MKDETKEIFRDAGKSPLIFSFLSINLFPMAFKDCSIEFLVPLDTGESVLGCILMTLFL